MHNACTINPYFHLEFCEQKPHTILPASVGLAQACPNKESGMQQQCSNWLILPYFFKKLGVCQLPWLVHLWGCEVFCNYLQLQTIHTHLPTWSVSHTIKKHPLICARSLHSSETNIMTGFYTENREKSQSTGITTISVGLS